MKYLFVILVLFLSFKAISQDKNWSVEFNYPLIISSQKGNLTGVIDGGLKFRFVRMKSSQIGLSFSYDYVIGESGYYNNALDNSFFHINLFQEITFPALKPANIYVSLGYTSILNRIIYNSGYIKSDIFNGFNSKVGLVFDLNKKLFLQTNYQYIMFTSPGKYDVIEASDRSFLKLGIGYRF